MYSTLLFIKVYFPKKFFASVLYTISCIRHNGLKFCEHSFLLTSARMIEYCWAFSAETFRNGSSSSGAEKIK